MKTCILTVIKNEHEYLDEWIQYHLDLGIDHIFIFEDIDSESHKGITDKYESEVTLQSINNILNESERKTAIELKRTKTKSVHFIYVKNGLEYLKTQHKEYDWCFVIDCDEFITLEEDNLNNIFSLYNSYDAVVLQWKIYGAAGIIKKPDYSKSGVVNTYLEEFKGNVPEKEYALSKTCYNLKTFDKSYFWNPHQPSNSCNWCRTDFTKNRNIPSYSNIFIRHYITKSWEEYKWKIDERGFMWGLRRNYDFFFIINPDLEYLKDQLTLCKETLVIMPYKQSSSQGNEIRFTLNGWRKYCQFKYHFVIIGEFNEELKNEFPWVEWIHYQSKPQKAEQYNPHLDIMNKFEWVRQRYSDKYNGFVYITDDNYAIRPFTLEDIVTIYYLNPSFNGRKDQPTSYWNHDKWKTRQLLDREGLPHINYTTHHPYYMEFSKLKEIMDKYNLLEESYVFDDIYFNYFSHPEPIQVNCIRLGIWSKKDFDEKFQDAVNNPNIKFICNSVEGWSKELEQKLSKLVE